jgi:hypothetical protein
MIEEKFGMRDRSTWTKTTREERFGGRGRVKLLQTWAWIRGVARHPWECGMDGGQVDDEEAMHS